MENTQQRACLTVKNGKQTGTTFGLFEGDKKIIGRDNNCHIQILDKGISRNHSLLEWKGGHFLLVDLGSTNGTFVNNKIIISRILQEGDILKIGQTEIQYNETRPKATLSASFVMDELVENSPHTIMERVDVSHSLCMSSQQPAVASKQQAGSEAAMAELYLSTIYELSNLINAEQDQNKLFETIMDKIMDVFKSDRGFLVLKEDKGDFDIKVIRGVRGEEAKLSHTILKKSIHEGISVLSANAMLDDRFSGGLSIVSQNIKSVMSVPLESSSKILGAIYVDSIGASNRFKKAHLDLLTTIGKQAGVAVERAFLFKQFLEKEKLQQSLRIAQDIQKSLLPSGVPEEFEYDLVGWNLTCDEVGGDYYDLFPLADKKWGLTIGDVTGHGVGAALLMATARAFLKALAWKARDITSMMNELNILLEQDMEDDKFMTLFYAVLDPENMILRYANAGHDAPLIYRASLQEFETLESTGIPLGMMEDFEYEEGEPIQIQTGDILVLSTDGITESMNPEGEQFGIERFTEVIRQSSQKSANQIIRDCYDTLQKFCRGTPQRDDLTLVVVKFDRRLKKETAANVMIQYTAKK